MEEFTKWGGPPGPRPPPVGLVFRVERKSRTRGSGADEGVRPTANYVANFRDTTLAALVVSLPAGRGSATPLSRTRKTVRLSYSVGFSDRA